MATDRASFGSFLSDRPGSQHPHPRGQRRRHIEDLFARADELLGQQIAHASGRLDSPGPLRVAPPRPTTATVCWQVARTLISASCCSSRPMATAVWDALWGSIPMMTVISCSFVVG